MKVPVFGLILGMYVHSRGEGGLTGERVADSHGEEVYVCIIIAII